MLVGHCHNPKREKHSHAHDCEKRSLFACARPELIGGVGEGLGDERA